jgi:hypothetical protein
MVFLLGKDAVSVVRELSKRIAANGIREPLRAEKLLVRIGLMMEERCPGLQVACVGMLDPGE